MSGRVAVEVSLGKSTDAATRSCTASRHDGWAWQRKECCCESARVEFNRRQRIVRKERELGRPRRVPAGPSQRQVRDLMAAGWPAREIALRIGWKCGELHALFGRKWLHRNTAERIAAVWVELHAVAGPSEMTRRRAARADLWLPPAPADDSPDEAAILRACEGERLPLTRAERYEAVRILHHRGLSYDEIEQRLHTNVARALNASLSAGFPVEQGRSA